jgi:hypothetical protein
MPARVEREVDLGVDPVGREIVRPVAAGKPGRPVRAQRVLEVHHLPERVVEACVHGLRDPPGLVQAVELRAAAHGVALPEGLGDLRVQLFHRLLDGAIVHGVHVVPHVGQGTVQRQRELVGFVRLRRTRGHSARKQGRGDGKEASHGECPSIRHHSALRWPDDLR